MTADAVAKWLETIRKNDELRFRLVQDVREIILKSDKGITEEIKYGGILFFKGEGFCGIFSYTAHISLEFSKGAELPDAYKILEGKGKGRRHIKIAEAADVKGKHVKHYIELAYKASV